MAKISCFSFLLAGKKKRSKVSSNVAAHAKKQATAGDDCPNKVNPVEFVMEDTAVDVNKGSGGGDAPPRDTAVAFVHAPPAHQTPTPSRQARDEAAGLVDGGEDSSSGGGGYSSGANDSKDYCAVSAEPEEDAPEESASSAGRRMSPTTARSPRLKRSCSNIETTARSVPVVDEEFDLPAKKSRSYGDLIKALSSSPRDGRAMDAAATVRDPKNKEIIAVEEEEEPVQNQNQNQCAAFSSETSSSLDRVCAWVNSLGNGSFHVVVDDEVDVVVTDEHDDDDDDGAVRRGWLGSDDDEIVECSSTVAAAAEEKRTRSAKRRIADQAAVHQASSIAVQTTLNAVFSVANISGMGLKDVPVIAAFSSLRAVNLSGNFIVRIYPGTLPKGLHSLDLSRNKISTIEGLRELTRLRVLNLSYNRIARIGHGLSSCTAIRELSLAGNKISDVEGLHRLLKLTVLDVGFNRITTAKSLGQLVANYGSLRALDLVGNPVQANVGDDTLRKAVSGLLPRLEYLNKQAVKPQRARQVVKDSVAQAALGNGGGGGWGRRTSRRVSQSPGSSGKSCRGRSKTRAQGSSVPMR